MTSNYLDLDINKLFEEHTIKEIEQIQKKIQHESDRKKIELRTLVGERYRDLILAADTIAKMKITSQQVITQISNIEDKFRMLQSKYIVGFKIEDEPIKNKSEKKVHKILDSVIVQIKILMDLPEYIWSGIESKELLFATQLFIVAQHVNYSLTFEVGSTELLKKYPIVAKQWDVISEFKNIILNECDETLQSLDVSIESAANCLASLVLLNGASITELLEKLIFMRSHAVESIIKDENDCSVKSRIKLCLEILVQTVNLIYSCFINGGNKRGLILEYITRIKDQDAYSLLSRLDVNSDILKNLLPSMTKNHKPFTQFTQDDFSSITLQTIIKSWLKWVEEFCNREITKLLDLVISVKGLHNIREKAVCVCLPENWNNLWEDLHLPRITFWVEFFQPLITDRAKSIVSDKWTDSLSKLKSDLIELLSKVVHEKYEFPEHDLRWFIWKDSPSDIPHKLTKNGGLNNKRPLLMKTKGFSPNIVKLCENFDNNLHSLLADLEQYLYETEKAKSIKDNILCTNTFLISNTLSDRSDIQDHLQNISSYMIEDLLNFLKNIVDKPEYGEHNINLIILARFLLAITLLCTNLNKCFTLSKISGLTITNTRWQTICDNLKEESILIWGIWAKMYKNTIREYKDKYLVAEQFNGLRIHLVVAEWEKVAIEENSGEGKRIKSEILVPYQPSIFLNKFLTAVNKDLNKVMPHTIPKRILYDIIEDVATELLNYYWNASNSTDLRQKQALQVVFDIKFITLLMVPRENKALVDTSTKACNTVLSRIDPFDYDVYNPYVQSNVKKSVQKSLLIFGNLVPHIEQLHSVLGARSEYSTGDSGKSDRVAVLAVCTGAPWFPPLAITAPMQSLPLVTVSMPEKVQRKKGARDNIRNDSAGASIKSGAAAFFGAMGSDWFSSN